MIYKDRYLDNLIKSNKVEWDKMINHKFVKEMVNGTLDKKYFDSYLSIENSFVLDAIGHMAMALYYSDSLISKKIILRILDGLLNNQLNYFNKLLDDQIKVKIIPKKAMLFKQFMKNCSMKGYEDIVVSFLAAESLYNNWCSIEKKNSNNNLKVYSDWINLHTDKIFYEQVKFFANESQRLNNDIMPSIKQKEIFKNTLLYEIEFHDSIYFK